MLHNQYCWQKKIKCTSKDVLFMPYLYYHSSWWNFWSYLDPKPFKILENQFDKDKIQPIIDVEIALDVLNQISEFDSRKEYCKKACITDLILFFILMIIISVAITSIILTKLSNILFVIVIILKILLILGFITISKLVKTFYFNKLLKDIEKYFLKINCETFISVGREWFVEKKNSEFTGFLGIRFYCEKSLDNTYDLTENELQII